MPAGSAAPHARAADTSPAPLASAAAPAILAALAAVIYLPLLRVPFVADDYPNVLHPWNFVAAASPLFRPVESALIALQADTFGHKVGGYHVVSLGLHVGCVLAVYALALRLAQRLRTPAGTSPRMVATVAALVFLANPRAVQGVVWPSAVGNLMCALGFLGGVLAWPRRTWLAAALYFVALGAKEAAIVLPVVLCFLPREAAAGVAPTTRARLRAWLAATWRQLMPVVLVGSLFGAFEAVRPRLLRLLGDHAPFIWPVTGGYHLVGGTLLLRNLVCYPALVFLPWLAQDPILGTWRQWLLAPVDIALIAWWLRAGGLRRLGALWILATAAPALLFAPFDISDLYLYLPGFGLALGAGELAAGFRVRLGHAQVRQALPVLLAAALLVAEGAALANTEKAWRHDGVLFVRERQALVAVARARPAATIVARGLPVRQGEVYLWMDAAPYVLQWLVPDFRGRLYLDSLRRPEIHLPGAIVLDFDATTGRLLPATDPAGTWTRPAHHPTTPA